MWLLCSKTRDKLFPLRDISVSFRSEDLFLPLSLPPLPPSSPLILLSLSFPFFFPFFKSFSSYNTAFCSFLAFLWTGQQEQRRRRRRRRKRRRLIEIKSRRLTSDLGDSPSRLSLEKAATQNAIIIIWGQQPQTITSDRRQLPTAIITTKKN